jgi:uncharacterized protein YndB with AHSA1/START domain
MTTQNNFELGALSEVECHANENKWALVFVRDLRHPPEKVWAALADPAHLVKWAPYTSDRNLGSTGAAILRMNEGEEPEDFSSWVSRAEPSCVLEHTWGADLLRWNLEAINTGTRLTLSHTTQKLGWVPKMAAGWHICLVVAESMLDGQSIGPIVGKKARDYGWENLNDTYAKKLAIPNTGWPLDP